jgi:hypothetical protein
VGVVVVCLGWGIYLIVRPPAPSPAVGILGYVDPTPPPPSTAKPRPTTTPTVPPAPQ